MRVIVTGSRDWTDKELVRQALEALPAGSVIVHGRAPGADTIAGNLAHRIRGLREEPHPALWKRYGRPAGLIRNQEMVDAGADLCLGFALPGAVGTWDCLARASAVGIPCEVVLPDGSRRTLDPAQVPRPRLIRGVVENDADLSSQP